MFAPALKERSPAPRTTTARRSRSPPSSSNTWAILSQLPKLNALWEAGRLSVTTAIGPHSRSPTESATSPGSATGLRSAAKSADAILSTIDGAPVVS